MKTRKTQSSDWKFPKLVYKVFLVFIIILFLQLGYLSLSPIIYGINMDKFSSNRNTVKTTLYANRGNIYDNAGNTLALNMSSYTVIAYLSESRTGSNPKPLHVVDKKMTATKLAPLLKMSVEYIEGLLSHNSYQVELGPGGRGITELEKDAIADLGLPGIDFVENHIRRYPNGDFASYILGYAKQYEDGGIVGELGLEAKYNDLLKGTDGSLEYQRDRFGYKIPDTKEKRVSAKDGSDIYLTLDANIQRFIEAAVKETATTYNPEWLNIAVMDAKTGKILGNATSPSFNPNIRDIVNYENPLLSYLYEPGSVMKIYTYMCAIEKGTYDGNATFQSGSLKIGDNTINDWNGKGWGTITYDKGFEYSSNVGVSTMMQSVLKKNELRECLKKYGFGAKTDIELPRELVGSTVFNYPIEVAAASYGQGITTTAIQQLQALTIVANNGKMVKPHIVDKIVDPNTKKVVYESKLDISEQLASTATINKIKELMYNVIHGVDQGTTGYAYEIEGFDLIGKTGTSQIFNNATNEYLYGTNDYIYSFAGMFPKNDPEIIIYAAMKKPTYGTSTGLTKAVKSIINSVAKYKNMFSEIKDSQTLPVYEISSYISKDTTTSKNQLQNMKMNTIVLGNGDKVIDQYPKKGTKIIQNDKVILMTNDPNLTLPNMIGWSSSEVKNMCNILDINCKLEGYGYITNQTVKAGTAIIKKMDVTFTLSEKFNITENPKTT